MSNFIPRLNIRQFYRQFDVSITEVDCGQMCSPHHPTGKPFCCDIWQAVPSVYRQEWDYLRLNTDLWHVWRGDECDSVPEDVARLESQIPEYMIFLACTGPKHCQRDFRAMSCRQFPFFPYVTADYRFLGMAYEWSFESVCWVISNLGAVTEAYRESFIRIYDELFALWDDEFEAYAAKSEEMREYFISRKRRIPILHRNGGYFLLSPRSERIKRVSPEKFRKFDPYG